MAANSSMRAPWSWQKPASVFLPVRVMDRRHSRTNSPIFSPKSIFWRVNREIACGLAAPRAVLMQIAHPLVAAGVADHSDFSKHRFARLYRTAFAAAAITFGSRDFALRAVKTVNQKHRAVHGVLKEQAGIFPAGTPYD